MNSRKLIIAAFVLLALSGLVWWSKKHPDAGSSDTPATATVKIADIPASSVQRIELDRRGAPPITVQRDGTHWAITAPESLPADSDTVASMLATLNPLNADSVVEEHAANIAQFGLVSPSLVVKLSQKSGKTQQLTFGLDVPIGSLTYVSSGSNARVYAVASSSKSAFDKGVNDLRDKRLLTFDANRLTSLELQSAKSDIAFAKVTGTDWQIVKPQSYRADDFQVGELVRKLSETKMDLSGSAEDTKKAGAAFASGTDFATVKTVDPNGTETLSVHKNKEDYWARSTAVKGTYKLASDVGTALAKSLDDFRNKKLFDFGFNDPNKIEWKSGSANATYVRSGTDWKANGKVLDPSAIQSFIDKLRDVSATRFLPEPFGPTLFNVTVVSSDGKRTEVVEFSNAGGKAMARRQNDAAVYGLDTSSVDDLAKAQRDIKPAKK